MGFSNLEHDEFYEDGQGEMLDHEEINSTTSHRNAQATCAKARYAIAVVTQ